LTINSARRSQAYQRKLAASCSTSRCATPWTSEHEAWLALDLWVNGWNIKAWSGKYYQWLMDNAHLYWFHNSYQKWMQVDGKMVEPRHWRYVWVDLATMLHDNNQTFAEYFYQNIEPKI
jgi:LAS superfamily LD-carboxypeptidase LdcB